MMKLSEFSFKTEAIWTVASMLGLPLLGLVVVLVLLLVRYLNS